MNGIIIIFVPLVFEKAPDLLTNSWLDWVTTVEAFQYAEELCKSVLVLDRLIKVMESIDNFKKLLHDVTEAGDSSHHDYARQHPFVATLGMVVSQTNSRKRGGRVINSSEHYSHGSLFLKRVSSLEMLCIEPELRLRIDEYWF